MVGWSDTDNKANLSPASLRYAANGAVAELGKKYEFRIIIWWYDVRVKSINQNALTDRQNGNG